MGIENYETLLYCKINLNQTGIGWAAPVLKANFGAGYEVGVVTAPYGLHRWTLTANVLPELEDYTVEYTLDTNTFTSTRFRYFFDFFKRHLLLGDKPFIIRDADNNKRYLVSFAEPSIDFERLAYQLFSGGVTVKERRVRDLAFNDDGSIVDENTPYIALFAVNAISDTVIRLNMGAGDADEVTGYDLEFSLTGANPQAAPGAGGWTNILDDATPVAVYDHTGRTGSTRYYYRFRARDEDENVSPWVFGNDITGATPDTTEPEMTSLVVSSQTDPTKLSIAYLGSDNQTIPANLRYDLQWSLDGIGGWTNLLTKSSAASPFIHTGREPSTHYFYRARVWDEADNFSEWMLDDDITTSDTTDPEVDAFDASGGLNQITITAEFSDDILVTGVDLDWSANGTTGWASLLNNAAPDTPTTETFIHTELLDDTTVFYRFRVRDGAGNVSEYANDSATTSGGVGTMVSMTYEDGDNITYQDGDEATYA